MKILRLILAISLIFSNHIVVFAAQSYEPEIEPGTYIFVSFSMNDESLRSYFLEAQKYNATLVMRGLSGDKNSRNRFAATKAKIEKAKINIDINPNLFEQLNIEQVPVIAVVGKDGSIKKISGHISLQKALELMADDDNPVSRTKHQLQSLR